MAAGFPAQSVGCVSCSEHSKKWHVVLAYWLKVWHRAKLGGKMSSSVEKTHSTTWQQPLFSLMALIGMHFSPEKPQFQQDARPIYHFVAVGVNFWTQAREMNLRVRAEHWPNADILSWIYRRQYKVFPARRPLQQFGLFLSSSFWVWLWCRQNVSADKKYWCQEPKVKCWVGCFDSFLNQWVWGVTTWSVCWQRDSGQVLRHHQHLCGGAARRDDRRHWNRHLQRVSMFCFLFN